MQKDTLIPALSRPWARVQVLVKKTRSSDFLSLWERVRVRVTSLIEEIEREKAMIVKERGEKYGV